MTCVLVVEDDEMSRDMLSRRLTLHGYEVLIAADGIEALDRIEEARPDVILMDMSLPRMDGWEATRHLKGSPQTQDIPVVALSAHAMAEDRHKARRAGCNDYLTKPVDFARLLEMIQGLLGPTV